eukprot:7386333-Prymnesium_polylepis.2
MPLTCCGRAQSAARCRCTARRGGPTSTIVSTRTDAGPQWQHGTRDDQIAQLFAARMAKSRQCSR